MDPKACLIRLDQAISDLDYAEAYAALDDYRAWRKAWGFEPEVYGKRGDVFLHECARRLHDAAIQSQHLDD